MAKLSKAVLRAALAADTTNDKKAELVRASGASITARAEPRVSEKTERNVIEKLMRCLFSVWFILSAIIPPP